MCSLSCCSEGCSASPGGGGGDASGLAPGQMTCSVSHNFCWQEHQAGLEILSSDHRSFFISDPLLFALFLQRSLLPNRGPVSARVRRCREATVSVPFVFLPQQQLTCGLAANPEHATLSPGAYVTLRNGHNAKPAAFPQPKGIRRGRDERFSASGRSPNWSCSCWVRRRDGGQRCLLSFCPGPRLQPLSEGTTFSLFFQHAEPRSAPSPFPSSLPP